MCGIFGFDRLTSNTEALIPVLAVYMADRGRDSWGMTNGIERYVDVGSIVSKFSTLYREWDCSRGLIFHTRGASAGMPVVLDNAHPFMFTKDLGNNRTRQVCGIHNGYISNHYGLKNHYQREQFGVDSKHIFAHIIEDKPLSELDGSAVISYFDVVMQNDEAVEDGLYLGKFKSDALHIAVLTTGELVFASTPLAIAAACILTGQDIVETIQTKPDIIYKVVYNENDNVELVEYKTNIEFGSKAIKLVTENYADRYRRDHTTTFPTNYSQFVNNGSHTGYRPDKGRFLQTDYDTCDICGTRINPAKEALCGVCFEDFMEGEITIWADNRNSHNTVNALALINQ